jgi:glycosyltransferase involved in cell wall biosynthesis
MEDLAIIIDGRPLRYYPLATPGFHGGTELYIQKLAHGLAERGHTVHVIANDLVHEEQRGPTEWWWGPENHPQIADVVMAASTLETIGDLSAPMLVLLPNGIDPLLFGHGSLVDAVACFSDCHVKLMAKVCPELAGKCQVTGLGVDLAEYPWPRKQRPVHGRMLFSNDPARGLKQTLDIFDCVKKRVADATLHIAYDFNRQFEQHRWSARCMAEILWECKRRIESDPAIVSLGGLTHTDLLREQYETQVHTYPSDPPNSGSQIHGMLQMELAAAGVPLVLSDIEAFPEIFGEAATLLPVIGRLAAKAGNDMVRVDAQDWADVTVELMKSPKKWKAASQACRRLAERHTWGAMVTRFEEMIAAFFGQEAKAA